MTNVNVALANSFIVINVGGGPTDDKPTVTLETPPDPDRTSSFLNIRVKDIQAKYEEWSARGAEFLTPPKQHPYEIRCYIRDPDGYLIEVGQTTDPEGTGRRGSGLRRASLSDRLCTRSMSRISLGSPSRRAGQRFDRRLPASQRAEQGEAPEEKEGAE